MGDTGAFSAGASRRCCPWRYFIPAGCLGCFSFLLGGQLLCWGDLGFLDVAGAGGSPDSPHFAQSQCADGASWSDPPSSRNSWRSRQSGEGAGMLWGWDLVASDPLSLTPSGREGEREGSALFPVLGELSVFWAEFPASPSCCWNFGGAPACRVQWGLVSPLCWEGEDGDEQGGISLSPYDGLSSAFLGVSEGKDLMSPRVPSSHTSFSQPLCQQGSGFLFFSPLFFVFPSFRGKFHCAIFSGDNLAFSQQLPFCCGRCRRARGGWLGMTL